MTNKKIDQFKVNKDGYKGFPYQLFSYAYGPWKGEPNTLFGNIVKGGWSYPDVLFELNQWYKETFVKFNFHLKIQINHRSWLFLNILSNRLKVFGNRNFCQATLRKLSGR